jgi:hypothetical protein
MNGCTSPAICRPITASTITAVACPII